MSPDFFDQERADRYGRFQFDFPSRTLAGKVILIPGGSGGLGAATVALLAGEGAQVVVGYHQNTDRAERLAAALEGDGKGSVHCVQADIHQAEGRDRLLAAATGLGELYGLVSFVGDPARVDFNQLDDAALHNSFNTNYIAPFLLAKLAGEHMLSHQTAGILVFLATMQAVAPFEGSINYAVPKAALVHAARILARQWGPSLRVNVVAPGVSMAGMALKSIQSGKYDSYVKDKIIPRFGRPEDVARAVRFFLEPDNYITGQVLTVDGGLTLRRGIR
jgi:pteridine reductase